MWHFDKMECEVSHFVCPTLVPNWHWLMLISPSGDVVWWYLLIWNVAGIWGSLGIGGIVAFQVKKKDERNWVCNVKVIILYKSQMQSSTMLFCEAFVLFYNNNNNLLYIIIHRIICYKPHTILRQFLNCWICLSLWQRRYSCLFLFVSTTHLIFKVSGPEFSVYAELPHTSLFCN